MWLCAVALLVVLVAEVRKLDLVGLECRCKGLLVGQRL
jgi:hypothetical protein